MDLETFSILSLALSTIAFFVARHYGNGYLEESGIPKGMTRGTVVFAAALAVSYGVGLAVDRLVI